MLTKQPITNKRCLFFRSKNSVPKRHPNRQYRTASLLLVFIVTLTFSIVSIANDEISEKNLLILDFELNDLTLNPAIEEEEKRVALLRPMLTDELQSKYGWQIKDLDDDTRASAQKGKGYLFDRPSASGELGKLAQSRWVITGRLHKASFLFVYLKAQLIDTETLTVKADFVVEIKGAAPKLTRKGIDALALQITDSINGSLIDTVK